ncbi:MAG TPA: DUF2249 domain-containing protein [Longimicrobiales bacterium]
MVKIPRTPPAPTGVREPKPEFLAALAPERIVDLDVRDDLLHGREPFSRIMAAREALPDGSVLRVRAVFEPVPLYRAMGRYGFTHWTEMLGEEDWRVWFWRPETAGGPTDAAEPQPATGAGDGAARAAGAAADPAGTSALPDTPAAGEAASGAAGEEGDDVVVLDVRGLEPPEPMVRTLEALEHLPAGATLVQINVRVPRLLLPRLEERGFTYEIREQSPDLVRVFIRRSADTLSTSQTEKTMPDSTERTLDVRVIPPREKHPTIFRTFEELAPGGSFVLINDHDPRPLRYQFEAEMPGKFGWEYLEQGPEVWRVRILKRGDS